MIGDYEDDTHFCLKCHTTIIGLDNYVSHRKAGCSKNVVDLPKSPLPSQLLPPDDSFNLKADDFFSSLELQSSTKKLTPSSSGKNFSGILTRSKTTAVIQASTSHKDQEIPQSKSGKNVWIGGHQLKLGYGDNQSKLIKAVDNLERRKEDPPKIDVYEESDVESEDYDYDVDESSDDDNHDAPPRNHTGGKWKPSSPIQWNRPQDWNVPPPSYTGGKWKPSLKRISPPPSHTKGKWKPSYPLSPKETYDFPPPTFTGSKWSQSKARHDYDVPPSNHTKGKWKPDDEPKEETIRAKGKVKKDPEILSPTYTSGKWKPPNIDGPSPNYTKGKWIPQQETKKNITKITDDSPFRKSSGTVQYWCRPCNRRLASKIVYERHLKSELHFKRTLHDKEFEDNLGVITEKRSKKKNNTESVLVGGEVKIVDLKKRKRKKIFVKCEVCNSKVNKNLMGKHLISHYHCRKGDISTPVAKVMVLDNIGEIVLQSPFQCGICRFYFNHQKDFLQHWLSDYHTSRGESRDGYYWCSFCKFKDEDSGNMYNHLISREHEEVISVINRSVPIVIKKINPVKCEECGEEFLLNFALVKHCQNEGHKSTSLISNLNNFKCLKCGQGFRSNISLKRHKQNIHGENIFICTVCNKNFRNKEEAKLHRNTSEHRYKILAKKGLKEKKCDYCNDAFQNLLELKEHLRAKHREFSPRCLHCGAIFTLPQELTVHLRTKSCSYKKNFDSANSCDKCPFASNSTSDLLFHKVLHTEPLLVPSSDPKKKPVAEYKCPLCEKLFVKSSLQAHLRVHTKERPFVCSICKKGFVRKNNWMLHVRNHDRKNQKKLQEKEKREACGNRPFLCSTCGANFKKKSILQQHMTTHSGKLCKCPKLGCVFAARSMGELKQHFRIHSDQKNFACAICDYRGKTKQQLKRHLTVHNQTKKYTCTQCAFSARTMSHLKRHARLHTGSKPFSCPHCDYKCNTLENLRKHVLSTNKHRGKCIYECKFCQESPFQSNFAKEFKGHLITEHLEIFKTGREAASYIAGIYDVQDDFTELPITSLGDNQEEATAAEKDRTQPKIIILQQSNIQIHKDPVVAASTSKDPSEDGNPDEIFPMFVVPKGEIVTDDNLTETWNAVVGSYDVEESGALVPFNNDNVLFQGHF